ncbi:hypothetical protein HBI56_113460 [Parastagonospora nodorum]|uniref:Uncharacterized protein n=1 Tax=Phaeosphaeria nodorum (strain SN15 / ATCC MYA-4574 / FGSC 10173) TaxID=321614 RepID=A0A7U2I5C5_PHANO|nr:hypothetical protein HBH56_194310 [Parastagonospora nodorum]QRD00442.1 hypothetical protein JI435_415180 [Parastagonospora nodorum SN15]KAH3924957.1 hypothetical protein HBH54_189210 [Parastagonospora nodorum]KAH3953290.1 hypothetical protein HBH53_041340 [Parastagonospora nodorum]KAH3976481.1 hypothetical protein HBH52_117170 [Parastagonospora nodorum]
MLVVHVHQVYTTTSAPFAATRHAQVTRKCPGVTRNSMFMTARSVRSASFDRNIGVPAASSRQCLIST